MTTTSASRALANSSGSGNGQSTAMVSPRQLSTGHHHHHHHQHHHQSQQQHSQPQHHQPRTVGTSWNSVRWGSDITGTGAAGVTSPSSRRSVASTMRSPSEAAIRASHITNYSSRVVDRVGRFDSAAAIRLRKAAATSATSAAPSSTTTTTRPSASQLLEERRALRASGLRAASSSAAATNRSRLLSPSTTATRLPMSSYLNASSGSTATASSSANQPLFGSAHSLHSAVWSPTRRGDASTPVERRAAAMMMGGGRNASNTTSVAAATAAPSTGSALVARASRPWRIRMAEAKEAREYHQSPRLSRSSPPMMIDTATGSVLGYGGGSTRCSSAMSGTNSAGWRRASDWPRSYGRTGAMMNGGDGGGGGQAKDDVMTRSDTLIESILVVRQQLEDNASKHHHHTRSSARSPTKKGGQDSTASSSTSSGEETVQERRRRERRERSESVKRKRLQRSKSREATTAAIQSPGATRKQQDLNRNDTQSRLPVLSPSSERRRLLANGSSSETTTTTTTTPSSPTKTTSTRRPVVVTQPPPQNHHPTTTTTAAAAKTTDSPRTIRKPSVVIRRRSGAGTTTTTEQDNEGEDDESQYSAVAHFIPKRGASNERRPGRNVDGRLPVPGTWREESSVLCISHNKTIVRAPPVAHCMSALSDKKRTTADGVKLGIQMPKKEASQQQSGAAGGGGGLLSRMARRLPQSLRRAQSTSVSITEKLASKRQLRCSIEKRFRTPSMLIVAVALKCQAPRSKISKAVELHGRERSDNHLAVETVIIDVPSAAAVPLTAREPKAAAKKTVRSNVSNGNGGVAKRRAISAAAPLSRNADPPETNKTVEKGGDEKKPSPPPPPVPAHRKTTVAPLAGPALAEAKAIADGCPTIVVEPEAVEDKKERKESSRRIEQPVALYPSDVNIVDGARLSASPLRSSATSAFRRPLARCASSTDPSFGATNNGGSNGLLAPPGFGERPHSAISTTGGELTPGRLELPDRSLLEDYVRHDRLPDEDGEGDATDEDRHDDELPDDGDEDSSMRVATVPIRQQQPANSNKATVAVDAGYNRRVSQPSRSPGALQPAVFDAPQSPFEAQLQRRARQMAAAQPDQKRSSSNNVTTTALRVDGRMSSASMDSSNSGRMLPGFATSERAHPRCQLTREEEEEARRSAAAGGGGTSGALETAGRVVDAWMEAARRQHAASRAAKFRDAIDVLDHIFDDLNAAVKHQKSRPVSKEQQQQQEKEEDERPKAGGVRTAKLRLKEAAAAAGKNEVAPTPKRSPQLQTYARRQEQPPQQAIVAQQVREKEDDEHSLGSCSAEVAAINTPAARALRARRAQAVAAGFAVPSQGGTVFRPQPVYGQPSANPQQQQQLTGSLERLSRAGSMGRGGREGSSASTDSGGGAFHSFPRPATELDDVDALVAELQLVTDTSQAPGSGGGGGGGGSGTGSAGGTGEPKRRSFPTPAGSGSTSAGRVIVVTRQTSLQGAGGSPTNNNNNYLAPDSIASRLAPRPEAGRLGGVQQRSLDDGNPSLQLQPRRRPVLVHQTSQPTPTTQGYGGKVQHGGGGGGATLASTNFETINEERSTSSRITNAATHQLEPTESARRRALNGISSRGGGVGQSSTADSLNNNNPENYYEIPDLVVGANSPQLQKHGSPAAIRRHLVQGGGGGSPALPGTQPPSRVPPIMLLTGSGSGQGSSSAASFSSATSSGLGTLPGAQPPPPPPPPHHHRLSVGSRLDAVGSGGTTRSRAPGELVDGDDDDDDGFYDNIGSGNTLPRRSSRGGDSIALQHPQAYNHQSAGGGARRRGSASRLGSFLRRISGGGANQQGTQQQAQAQTGRFPYHQLQQQQQQQQYQGYAHPMQHQIQAASLLSLNKIGQNSGAQAYQNNATLSNSGAALTKSNSLSAEPWAALVLPAANAASRAHSQNQKEQQQQHHSNSSNSFGQLLKASLFGGGRRN